MKEIMMKEIKRLQKINDELESSKQPGTKTVIRDNILAMCEIAKIFSGITNMSPTIISVKADVFDPILPGELAERLQSHLPEQ